MDHVLEKAPRSSVWRTVAAMLTAFVVLALVSALAKIVLMWVGDAAFLPSGRWGEAVSDVIADIAGMAAAFELCNRWWSNYSRRTVFWMFCVLAALLVLCGMALVGLRPKLDSGPESIVHAGAIFFAAYSSFGTRKY